MFLNIFLPDEILGFHHISQHTCCILDWTTTVMTTHAFMLGYKRIAKTWLPSGSRQDTEGTPRGFHWREVNTGTTARGVGVSEGTSGKYPWIGSGKSLAPLSCRGKGRDPMPGAHKRGSEGADDQFSQVTCSPPARWGYRKQTGSCPVSCVPFPGMRCLGQNRAAPAWGPAHPGGRQHIIPEWWVRFLKSAQNMAFRSLPGAGVGDGGGLPPVHLEALRLPSAALGSLASAFSPHSRSERTPSPSSVLGHCAFPLHLSAFHPSWHAQPESFAWTPNFLWSVGHPPGSQPAHAGMPWATCPPSEAPPPPRTLCLLPALRRFPHQARTTQLIQQRLSSLPFQSLQVRLLTLLTWIIPIGS